MACWLWLTRVVAGSVAGWLARSYVLANSTEAVAAAAVDNWY